MQRIGPYELVHRIASGGMAEVWMGRRRAMGGASKAVAVKLLAQHLASKAIYRRMFVDEARLTMMLTHSNIVQVFDVGEHGGRSYLIMEWIDGLDLSRLAQAMRERGEAFPFEVVGHVIGEVLRGLAYAHGLTEGENSSTIVHRDISPHNVLISVSGEVKISDFGVARLASEETSGLHVRGKLRYMPPEQVRGKSRHATIDLFAVGAMLQELLDGVRFRAGLDRDRLFGMVIAGEVPALVREDVPEALSKLRDRLLEPDREQRLESAEAALALLRQWSGYRNATDELATLVRESAGVYAPRTGLTMDVSDDQLELESKEEATVREGSMPDDSSELATRTLRGADERGSETTPTPAPERIAPALVSRRVAWVPRWVAAAVLTFGVSLGFVYAYFSGLGTEPTEASALVEAQPVLEPALAVSLASSPEPVLRQAEGAQAGRAQLDGAQRDGAQRDGAQPDQEAAVLEPKEAKSNKVTKSAPARVEFAAHEFFFVWVKVGGHQYALEPLAAVELPPGRHKVWIRERKDDAWRAAGKIKVGSGRSYRVSLQRPAGLVLKTL